MRIGSLFSGAGGLDRAVEAVFGGCTVWHCEQDPAASKVLAYRWPGVPNLGDITAVDWSQVEPADVLCGGYPCQPFSAAGRRKGTSDDRHLWPYFAEAIRCLRPRFVVLENVAGHRSMGFDSVLGDLASMRFDAQWCSVRASDVGAPHRRERLFVLATDTERAGRQRGRPVQQRRASIHAARRSAAPADAPRNGRHEGWPESAGFGGGSDAAVGGHGPVDLLPTPDANSGNDRGRGQHPDKRRASGHAVKLSDVACHLLPTPSVADGEGGHLTRSGARSNELLLPGVARAYGRGELLPTPRTTDAHGAGEHGTGGQDLRTTVTTAAWGKYAPAIHHWEQLTRPAPAPTEMNKNGNPRLSATFAEWLMGWPAGWCTDPAIGISRNDQLRCIGNGVVPQQAIAALQWLLSIEAVAS